MLIFSFVWFGQFISAIGSGLTGFALGIWAYEQTGSISAFAFIYFCNELPGIVVAPIAGLIADRWNRRLILLLGDLGAGLSVLAIALLLHTHHLAILHIYLATVVMSFCRGFQEPAYFASVTSLVPPQHLGRAGGMIQLTKAAGHLISPVLAGILMGVIHLRGIILIDCITFLFAVISLLIVRFPSSPPAQLGQGQRNSFWQDLTFGWHYIAAQPGLLVMVLFFAMTNFMIGIVQTLLSPMVLSFTDSKMLGLILSIGGSGWLCGSVLMSLWGGPKRKIHGVLGYELLMGLAILALGLSPSPGLIAIALFVGFFSIPIVIGSSHALWQTRVEPSVQGRVFAMRGMISWSSFPLAYLVAGPLAERIFEPLLQPHGLLVNSVGVMIGAGSGRGIGLLFIILGILIAIVTAIAYQYEPLRKIEAGSHGTPVAPMNKLKLAK
jgi:MFS transporter, DHA3 family, macrolide efflux protein